jgi:hypothetical protein
VAVQAESLVLVANLVAQEEEGIQVAKGVWAVAVKVLVWMVAALWAVARVELKAMETVEAQLVEGRPAVGGVVLKEVEAMAASTVEVVRVAAPMVAATVVVVTVAAMAVAAMVVVMVVVVLGGPKVVVG